MIGSVAQKLGCFYGVNLARVQCSDNFRSKYDYTDDIAKFVEQFHDEGFFDYHQHRKHEHFPDFKSELSIKDATKFKGALLKRSDTMDLYVEALLL